MAVVPAGLRRVIHPVVDGSTYRRWVHLLLGGVLALPFVLLYTAFSQAVQAGSDADTPLLIALAVPTVALAVVIALIPAVRVLEVSAARALLGVPLADVQLAEQPDWSARWRAAGWFVLNIVVGGSLGFATVLVISVAAVLFPAAFTGVTLATSPDDTLLDVRPGWSAVWTAPVAVALLLVLVYLAAGVGAVLARWAPSALGPSPAERFAALQRREAQLRERARLARELHDSVGHALTITTLQAGAAARVIDSDPTFARKALTAIEQAGRAALADLDHVLGLLRDETASPGPQHTLADARQLLDTSRSAGVAVDAEFSGELSALPTAVSREAYRILQEGLTNVLRHAGAVPVTVRVHADADTLSLDMTNPLGGVTAARRARSGRGLAGMRERVSVLRGQLTAGADDGRWHVRVRIPLHPRPTSA